MDKVRTVMKEFKRGDLKSSSGQKVTNPKQAIAIGLSEAGLSKKAKGGEMKESKAMVKKEVGFMKKKGAPKSMIKHEEAEMGMMKRGGNVKKYASGGTVNKTNKPNYLEEREKRLQKAESMGREYGRELGQERQRKADMLGGVIGTPAAYITRAGQYIGDKFTDADAFLSEKLGMQERAASRRGERAGLKEEGYKKGGSASSASKRADGIANKGKTKGKEIRMASGGLTSGHKSADGIAKKGKTKGKDIKMAYGGKC
jgi:hypothetical protein